MIFGPGQSLQYYYAPAAIMGDWAVIQTQATPAKVPLSIVAISQANSSKVTRISPMPRKRASQL